jgi:hypothetical protein
MLPRPNPGVRKCVGDGWRRFQYRIYSTKNVELRPTPPLQLQSQPLPPFEDCGRWNGVKILKLFEKSIFHERIFIFLDLLKIGLKHGRQVDTGSNRSLLDQSGEALRGSRKTRDSYVVCTQVKTIPSSDTAGGDAAHAFK